MTYSVYSDGKCIVSGLTYAEAVQYLIDNHLEGAGLYPDNGEVNE